MKKADFSGNMRLRVLQPVAFEGVGFIETWAANRGHTVAITRLYQNEPLPHPDGFDWLIILGGPMSVQDTGQHSWLLEVPLFIQKAIFSGKTVVGICLGAQLIATALGARVYPNQEKEIGWFTVEKVPSGKSHPLLEKLPDAFEAFHWHGDTFDLPEGAVHLAQTAACTNQAFLYQNRVLGLQFHLEATPQTISGMLAHCSAELVGEAPFVQSEKAIQSQTDNCRLSNQYLTELLDSLG